MALTEKLTAIADAIRVQSGKTDKLSLEQMPTEIIDLQSLGFEVTGNPQPASPKENTIWVDTDAAITSWVFAAEQPEAAAEGMVWIKTDTESPAEFNALKKNGIQVYPVGAAQYTGGVWVEKDCRSYRGGEWVEWMQTLVLVPNTGIGWSTSGGASVSKTASGTNFSASVSNKATKYAQYTVDVTRFSKLTIKGTTSVSSSGSGRANCIVGLYKNGSLVSGHNGNHKGGESGTISQSIDLSALSGAYQVRFTAISQTDSTTAYNCYANVTSMIFE